MKANRKFLTDRDDDAVSPVIAVILMVAITVVLAATVYVWVSGFGAQSSSPAKSMAFSSAGVIANATTYDYKVYTVASASPGLKYSELELHLDGAKLAFYTTDCTVHATDGTSRWGACAGSTARAGTDLVTAGDSVRIAAQGGLSGETLRVIDPNSNSVILTLTVS